MNSVGMQVDIDAAGNVRGFCPGTDASAGSILIGSHLDSVPNAGAYDGVLGVVLGISLVEALGGRRLPFSIEVIGFSDEEGVRFGVPFIGSRAVIGDLDRETLQIRDRTSMPLERVIRDFGLDPARLRDAVVSSSARAYLEFHIEQGPVLESIGVPLGVVEAILGQSRASLTFIGRANHAGTTPMQLRQDALCAAAEWITHVENAANSTQGLVATVGKLEAKPGASNVVPGEVTASLDVRHAVDSVRTRVIEELLQAAHEIGRRRGLQVESRVVVDQRAVSMDRELTHICERALERAGVRPHRMTSGAGHDAMIVARRLPAAMIFLRSPGGISHHPDETVHEEDITLALRAGIHLLEELSTCPLHT